MPTDALLRLWQHQSRSCAVLRQLLTVQNTIYATGSDGGRLAFRKTAVGLITQDSPKVTSSSSRLEADDRLAAKAAVAKLFEHLARLGTLQK